MSSWNYRVVKLKQKNKLDPKYMFLEVCYDDKGKAGGYGDLFMTAGSKEELKSFIKGLRRALKEPVLNEEDL